MIKRTSIPLLHSHCKSQYSKSAPSLASFPTKGFFQMPIALLKQWIPFKLGLLGRGHFDCLKLPLYTVVKSTMILFSNYFMPKLYKYKNEIKTLL